MSEANVAAARWALAAFYGEDVEDARDLVHEDFEFVEAPDVPDAVRFSGENWLAELTERLGEVWEDPSGKFEAHEFIDLGEDVVVRGRLTLRGRTSGISVTNEIAILFQFCEGKLKRASNYPSEAAARAASSSSGSGIGNPTDARGVGRWHRLCGSSLAARFSTDKLGGRAMVYEATQAQARNPVAVPGDEGEARWWDNALAVIRATAADTDGRMTIVEVTEPPGTEAPLHVHHKEDQGFWILEGDVTFEFGDTTIEASAGDYAYVPRDIPQRYTVGESGCRMLFIFTPGGFEELLEVMSEPAASRTLPPPPEERPPSAEEPDMERFTAVMEAHGCEPLGED